LKVSIGTNIKEGPWGGGNLFAINLKDYLLKNGHKVVHDLLDTDIDIILITEPRKTSESSAFTHIDVLRYLKYVNYKALVFHRFNECDERKGTNYVNEYLIEANKVADHSIFVSNWLKNLFLEQGLKSKNNTVIYGGANSKIFNSKNLTTREYGEKIKIVTHHWGANWNKGFEIYSAIDDLLSLNKWKSMFSFTYIGNVPKNFYFKNSTLIPPMSGYELANEIKKNNLYITGSINEPSGNHHIEAAQCGLPILYINSGGTPEYCKEYGLEFNANNLEKKLEEMHENYELYRNKLRDYPHDSNKMCKEYLEVFQIALNEKATLLDLRKFKESNNTILKKLFNLLRSLLKIFSN
jgi:glycosyltransferase involved in cell wall biosynthesis